MRHNRETIELTFEVSIRAIRTLHKGKIYDRSCEHCDTEMLGPMSSFFVRLVATDDRRSEPISTEQDHTSGC
jgi:hypothetical protein